LPPCAPAGLHTVSQNQQRANDSRIATRLFYSALGAS
jgi:hypothetical protein